MKKLVPVLTFLTLALGLGPLPALGADGATLVAGKCTVCHTTKRICARLAKRHGHGWAKIVKSMVGRGAKLTAEEQAEVLDYLGSEAAGEAPFCK